MNLFQQGYALPTIPTARSRIRDGYRCCQSKALIGHIQEIYQGSEGSTYWRLGKAQSWLPPRLLSAVRIARRDSGQALYCEGSFGVTRPDLLMTPQAMRSPALPAGSLLRSSALA